MNAAYGTITGLVCVRYWLDAWDEGWREDPEYSRIVECCEMGLLSSDYRFASVMSWAKAVEIDPVIYQHGERGYYALLPSSSWHLEIWRYQVAGVVEARGRIDIHGSGWIRAEQMRILHLFLPNGCDPDYLAQLQKRYQVPINLVADARKALGGWLAENPWVAEHNFALTERIQEDCACGAPAKHVHSICRPCCGGVMCCPRANE